MIRAAFLSFMILSLAGCAASESEPAAQVDPASTLLPPAVQTSTDEPGQPSTASPLPTATKSLDSGSTRDGTPVPAELTPSPPTPKIDRITAVATLPSSSQSVIIFSQEGGLAGIQQTWEIYADGVVFSGSSEVCRVEPSQIAALQSRANEVGFFDSSYSSPPGICCDFFTFILTIRSGDRVNTINVSEGDSKIPPDLRDLLKAVQQVATCST